MERNPRSARKTILLGLACALWCGAAACDGSEPTLEIEVCGDIHVPGHADALRVTVLDADRQTRREAIYPLLECPQGKVRKLPQSVEFAPFDGDAWGAVQALKGSTNHEESRVVGYFEKYIELDSEESATLRLALNRDCLGFDRRSCATGQTCAGGRCRLARFDGDESTICASSEAGDTLRDTGFREVGDVGTMPPPSGGGNFDADVGEIDPEQLCASGDAGPRTDGSATEVDGDR